MPESHNVEIAKELSHEGGHGAPKGPWHRGLEVLEVAVLAIVAVATAWSGYQAAKWDGRQSYLYGSATRLRFQAESASTLGGQKLVGDATIFTAWLQAHAKSDRELMGELSRRFTPEYESAFHDWLGTDPFNDPEAPPGPGHMPSYVNPGWEEAARLNEKASATFESGTAARETADKFVRATVLFASGLFLVALAQRFGSAWMRAATNLIAVALVAYTTVVVLILPHL